MDEDIITWQQVYEAATPDELQRAHSYPHQHVPARDVVGRMLRLNMDKYDLVPLPHLRAWRLVRREPLLAGGGPMP